MNIYNKIQDEMNRTLSTAATAGLAILLLVGCSSAPATPAAKLPSRTDDHRSADSCSHRYVIRCGVPEHHERH